MLKKSTTASVFLVDVFEFTTSVLSGEMTAIQSLLDSAIAISFAATVELILPGTKKSISPNSSGSFTRS